MGLWRTKNGHRIYIKDDDEREGTLLDALMEEYGFCNLPTIKTTNKEYGLVYESANNDKYHNHKNNRFIRTECMNGYAYIVENHGYNVYRIIAKRKIKWPSEKNYTKS